MFKRISGLLVCALIGVTTLPCYANSIEKLNADPETDKLTLSGCLDKPYSNALVDLWMEDSNGKIVVLKQTTTNENGEYAFEVDLSRSLMNGGKFNVSVSSQTEEKVEYISPDGIPYVELYLSSEVDDVLTLIAETKEDINTNKTNIEQNKSIIEYKFPLFRSIFSKNEFEEIATFVKNSNMTTTNAEQTMRELSEIKTVQNGTKDDIVAMLEDDKNLQIIKNNELFKKLDSNLYDNLASRLVSSDVMYNSPADFTNEVEDLTTVTALNNVRGNQGLQSVIDNFSAKFDLTTFNRTGNNKSEVLKSIQRAVENNQINRCSDVQGLLNTYISTNTQGSGSANGGVTSGGSGSSGGGTKNQVSGSSSLISAPQFDNTNVQTEKKVFTDIGDFEWAKESIDKLVSAGIVDGVSDTEFAPAQVLTRAEFCKMIFKVFGMKNVASNNHFNDVKENDWFAPYVYALSSVGAVNGTDDKIFAPNFEISRQDVCAIVYRLLKSENRTFKDLELTFNDVTDIDEYAIDAVKALSSESLLKGDGDSFAPKRSMNRAEAAVLIARIHNYRNEGR